MWNNFFQDIDITGENVNIMDGNAEDLDQECADYEAKIKEAGGIHLLVAGGSIGRKFSVLRCCIALRCVALRCVALRCVALRCVALRCVALRCVALRCVVIRPDMPVVGISANGDVGCNETGSSLVSRTRVKSQSVEVIRRNAKFFGGDIRLVPTRALTVGIATVMEAREVGSPSIDRLRVLGEEGSCQPFSIRLTWGVITCLISRVAILI